MTGDSVDTDDEQLAKKLTAVIVATVVVSSMFAPMLAASVAADSPSGMVGVPDSHVQDTIPDHAADKIPDAAAFQGDTMTSEGASTLSVEVTTKAVLEGEAARCTGGGPSPPFCENPEIAFNFTDVDNDAGREVAVNASAVEDALGYTPEVAYVEHSSGETYTVPVERRGDLLVWELKHFSSNEVTFSGEFNLNATPAADGDQFRYNTSDGGGSDVTVNMTGKLSEEWDNESASGVGSSSSNSINVGGNADPSGPNGNPTLTVTGYADVQQDQKVADPKDDPKDNSPALGDNDMAYGGEFAIDNPPDTISKVKMNFSSSSDAISLSMFIDCGDVDQTWDGTEVKKFTVDPGTEQTVDISDFDASACDTVEVEIKGNADTSYQNYAYIWYDRDTDGSVDGTKYDGSWSTNAGGWDIWLVGNAPQDLTASSETTSTELGNFTDGETKEVDINLGAGDSSLDFSSSSGGSLDYTLEMKERTQTVDPGVELNSCSVNHTGTLAEGETVTKTINQSCVDEGENTVNVTIGDGTLSSDAPTPQVGLDYSHDVVTNQSVDYNAEAWSERYAVSKTWSEDTANATLRVPWASERVIAVRSVNVEYYDENGDLQSSTTSPDYTHENGVLVVELGDVPAGWETRVEADGSKIQVVNGSVKLLQPTNAGDSMDSKIEITDHSEGFAIDVSGTDEGALVHYLANESWTDPSETAVIDNGGADQRIRVPGANSGSTAWVRTAPLEVEPQNDVVVTVVDPNEPRFRISPGASEGDSYKVTWLNAKSGETYELVSVTRDGFVIDKADANSPVVLEDDEDDSETLIIRLFESDGSDGGADSSGAPPLDNAAGENPITSPLILIPLGALTLLGLSVGARRTGAGRWVAFAGTGLVFVVAIVSLLPSTFGSVIYEFGGGLASGLESVSSVLWLGAGVLALYGLYLAMKRWLGVRPIQIRADGGK